MIEIVALTCLLPLAIGFGLSFVAATIPLYVAAAAIVVLGALVLSSLRDMRGSGAIGVGLLGVAIAVFGAALAVGTLLGKCVQ